MDQVSNIQCKDKFNDCEKAEFLVKILKKDINSLIENCYLLNNMKTLEEIDYNLEMMKKRSENEAIHSLRELQEKYKEQTNVWDQISQFEQVSR